MLKGFEGIVFSHSLLWAEEDIYTLLQLERRIKRRIRKGGARFKLPCSGSCALEKLL
jgi:hypothetical protein